MVVTYHTRVIQFGVRKGWAMAKKSRVMSVADLERILDERKSLLHQLARRRDAIQKELDKITSEIHGIVGITVATGRRGPVAGQKRPKNNVPLRDVIQQVLSKNKKGLTLSDLSAKVLEAGYKTNAKNFSNMVYQNIYNSEGVSLDAETGLYRLT